MTDRPDDQAAEDIRSLDGSFREANAESSSFAELVRSRRWVAGTVVSSPDPMLAEHIGQSFDFVWIDLEHGALSVRDAQTLAIAVRAGGAAALARLPSSDSELLGALLDAGVDGIVAPRVESGPQASRLVRRLRFPPAGTRGFAPRRAVRGRASVGAIQAARDVVCVVQIESRQALEHVDAIAATEGVDALVVGTADLSIDLGEPLDVSSKTLLAAIERTGDAAGRASKAWGVAIGKLPNWTSNLRAAGGSMLVFSSDTRLYFQAVDRCAARLRDIHAPQCSSEAVALSRVHGRRPSNARDPRARDGSAVSD